MCFYLFWFYRLGTSIRSVIYRTFCFLNCHDTITNVIKRCRIHVHLFRIKLNMLLALLTGYKHARSNLISFCSNIATGAFFQWVRVESFTWNKVVWYHISKEILYLWGGLHRVPSFSHQFPNLTACWIMWNWGKNEGVKFTVGWIYSLRWLRWNI